jgi:hypothetical protein
MLTSVTRHLDILIRTSPEAKFVSVLGLTPSRCLPEQYSADALVTSIEAEGSSPR